MGGRSTILAGISLLLACNGEPSAPAEPEPIHFVQISAQILTCGLGTDGVPYCWGGLPAEVTMPAGVVVADLSTGGDHGCAVSATGAAYCWGSNAEGAIGDGTRTNRPDPVPVVGGLQFSRVVAGTYHTCGLTLAGATYCWGDNAFGQLGDGTRTDRQVPTAVTAPPGVAFVSLSPGWGHTCALTTAGAAWCWGENSNGQLGDGTVISRLAPVAVALPAGVTSFGSIGLGSAHTCGNSSTGTLYCWGYGNRGRLGNGLVEDRQLPTLVTAPAGESFTTVGSAGYAHTCALTTAGAAWCWGRNANGEVGDGTTTERRVPVPVLMPAGVTFTRFAGGFNHSCALAADGSAWCWGINSSGQLGDGTNTNRSTPVRVERR